MAGAEEPGLLLSPTGLLHYIFPADVRLLAKQIGCDAYNLNQLFGWSKEDDVYDRNHVKGWSLKSKVVWIQDAQRRIFYYFGDATRETISPTNFFKWAEAAGIPIPACFTANEGALLIKFVHRRLRSMNQVQLEHKASGWKLIAEPDDAERRLRKVEGGPFSAPNMRLAQNMLLDAERAAEQDTEEQAAQATKQAAKQAAEQAAQLAQLVVAHVAQLEVVEDAQVAACRELELLKPAMLELEHVVRTQKYHIERLVEENFSSWVSSDEGNMGAAAEMKEWLDRVRAPPQPAADPCC